MAKNRYSAITPSSATTRAARSAQRPRGAAPARAPRVVEKPKWWRFQTRPTPTQWGVLIALGILAAALVITAIVLHSSQSSPTAPQGMAPAVFTVVANHVPALVAGGAR